MAIEAKITSMKKNLKIRSTQQILNNSPQPWEISMNITITAENGRDVDSYGLFPIIAAVDAAVQEELYRTRILKSHDGELDPELKRLAKVLAAI